MIELVVFDLDGVLADLCPVHRFAFRSALAQVTGRSIDPATESFLEGRPTRTKLELLGISGSEAQAIVDLKQELTSDGLKTLRRDQSKIDAITTVRLARRKVAVYTNSIEATTHEALSRIGIQFDFVLTNEAVKMPKPSPEGYEKVMARFGVSPDRTLILEDSPVGLAAAIRSGALVHKVESVKEVNGANMKAWLETADEVTQCSC